MPDLARPTVAIHYEDAGAGDPLIFLHGWCDSSASWAATIAEFSKTNRCLAPDMRGHGRSGQPLDHCYTPEGLTNDIVALCDAAGAGRPVLIGHSYGGYLAAEAARRFPGWARAIVVVDQQLALRRFVEQMRTIEPVIRGRESHLAFRAQWLESMLTPAMALEDRAAITAATQATPVDVALALWSLMFENSLEEVSQRSEELMVALGRQPSLTIESGPSPDYHEALLKLSPTVQAAVIHSGHWIHVEQPAAFRTLLHEFLARV